MENWLLMQNFYHGLTNKAREKLDVLLEELSCHSLFMIVTPKILHLFKNS